MIDHDFWWLFTKSLRIFPILKIGIIICNVMKITIQKGGWELRFLFYFCPLLVNHCTYSCYHTVSPKKVKKGLFIFAKIDIFPGGPKGLKLISIYVWSRWESFIYPEPEVSSQSGMHFRDAYQWVEWNDCWCSHNNLIFFLWTGYQPGTDKCIFDLNNGENSSIHYKISKQ